MSLFVLDCGSRGGTFFYDVETDNAAELPNENVINLEIPGLQSGDTIVIEDAHIRTRERLSLAQPFSYDELCRFKRNADSRGVTIKLFPQMSTPKARDFAGGVDKTDINDIQAIASYLEARPSVIQTLKNFQPVTLDEYRSTKEGIWLDKDSLSEDINTARNYAYGCPKSGDYNDGVTRWIDTHINDIYIRLSDAQREMLSMVVKFKGKDNERIDYNRTRLYTLLATLIKPDGAKRLRSDVGKLPFWKYVKENYFGMSPYHMKGGVAASNVKYHWRRHASGFAKTKRADIIADGRYQEFTDARGQFDKDLRGLWNLFRAMVLVTV
jgi:hypothetical protein